AKWGVLHPILPIDRVPPSRWGESLGGWVHFGEQAAFPPPPPPPPGAGSYPRWAKWGVLHPILPIDQVPLPAGGNH
ncbi:MAG: hypothetical protein KA314_24720, partial [Chloroflexi bacterium]|nr:hypothetical protein [Chloroflexota bacterium]